MALPNEKSPRKATSHEVAVDINPQGASSHLDMTLLSSLSLQVSSSPSAGTMKAEIKSVHSRVLLKRDWVHGVGRSDTERNWSSLSVILIHTVHTHRKKLAINRQQGKHARRFGCILHHTMLFAQNCAQSSSCADISKYCNDSTSRSDQTYRYRVSSHHTVPWRQPLPSRACEECKKTPPSRLE